MDFLHEKGNARWFERFQDNGVVILCKSNEVYLYAGV